MPEMAETPQHRPAAPRVALVAPGEIFGGAERQILTLLRAMRRRALSPALLTFHDAELARRARDDDFPVTVLGARSLLDTGSLRILRHTLRALRVDILHIHGYRSAVYCALAVRPGELAVVKTEHGMPESPGPRMRDRIRPALYRHLENWAMRRLKAHVVYVTDELRVSRQRDHAGLSNSVIYNGIEPLNREHTRRPVEYSPEHVNIAIVGRLEPVKGIEYAIRAMTHAGMPPAVRLNIVGTGPLSSPLEALARQLGVADRVRFVGFRRNVYDYIAHADALLMPSLHEGLPYTVLEAMSLGTPVLAARVGGLAEILVHEHTALLFQAADADAIAACVATFTASPSLRYALAAAASAVCVTRFSADAMAERYLELFHRLNPRASEQA